MLVPVNRAGWPFIGLFACLAVGLSYMAEPLGWLGVVLTLWCVYFFRDPNRVTPARDGLVIAPADGVVQEIQGAAPPVELGMEAAGWTRISIFMNIFDVHVNRVPAAGRIVRQAYRPGRFFNASLDKASEFNERHAVHLQTPEGLEIAFVQIAGLIARRIKCDLADGQVVAAGARFGLIRFGSRLDVYLPLGLVPLVAVGQRTLAGETVLADARAQEPARKGETR